MTAVWIALLAVFVSLTGMFIAISQSKKTQAKRDQSGGDGGVYADGGSGRKDWDADRSDSGSDPDGSDGGGDGGGGDGGGGGGD